MVVKLILLLIATVASFWISAICGGGASLILVPILNLLLPSSVIPFSLTIGTFTSSASRIVVFKKHINWTIFLWFVPFSIPAVLLGGWLMRYLDPKYLQFFVALFLIANLPELFRTKKQLKKEEKPYPKYILAIVGFLAGFVSGVTGAIGLLFNSFYLRYGLTKEQIVATRAANEICLHLIKLIIYLLLGLYSKQALWFGAIIAVGSIVSSYTVKFILPLLSEKTFRKIGYGAMVVLGFVLLINTSRSIIQQDNISFSTNKYDETTLNWRKNTFVLEYDFNDGLESERPIRPDELPLKIKYKYEELQFRHEKVYLEKVYRLASKHSYELYYYKNNKLVKIEIEE